MKEMHDVPVLSRLLAKVVRELLKAGACERLPDLTEALKVRCALLRIRWTNDDIGHAYELIRSNTPLPGDPPRVPEWVERPAGPGGVLALDGRADARDGADPARHEWAEADAGRPSRDAVRTTTA